LKQGALSGRTDGLRPAQRRRLERLCHRRHPETAVAEWLSLQRLAELSRELELPLTLVVDGRGLSRLLWVGPLEQSGRLLDALPGSPRRQGSGLRLITCCGRSKHLEPPLLEGVVAGRSRAELAAAWHRQLSRALVALAVQAACRRGCGQVALAGGCFQNALLLEGCIAGLRRAGLAVFWNEQLPCNDGGLALGQLWAALGSAPITTEPGPAAACASPPLG